MTLIRDPDKATREGVFAGELPSIFNDPKKAHRVVALIVGADGQPLTGGPGSHAQPNDVVRAEPTYALIEDQMADAPLPDVPAWANRALLRVTRGTLWFGYGDSYDSPGVPMGGSVELAGAELQVTRCRTSDGGIVRVDYWQVG